MGPGTGYVPRKCQLLMYFIDPIRCSHFLVCFFHINISEVSLLKMDGVSWSHWWYFFPS